MKMYDIDFADRVMKRPSQSRRPIKSSDYGTREVLNLNAVKSHRCSDWSGSNSGPITVGGKDLQFMPSCRQCSAEAMDRKDRSPIPDGGQKVRNHVEDAHCPTLQENPC